MPKAEVTAKARANRPRLAAAPPATARKIRDESISNTNNNPGFPISPSFQYGHLLLHLILDSVTPMNLLGLRCVNRRARDFIDRRIFKSVTLQTKGRLQDSVVPVVTDTGQRLPIPILTSSAPSTIYVFIHYALKYTTMLDLENVPSRIVQRLQLAMGRPGPNLEVLRLKSDRQGFHPYSLSKSLGARTMVVFPSFKSYIADLLTVQDADVPYGVEKLVQHLAFTFDWRGPILLHRHPRRIDCVKNEVWLMTLADLFGFSNSMPHSGESYRYEFLDQLAVRLKNCVHLTLVGLELIDGRKLLKLHGPDETVEQAISEFLREPPFSVPEESMRDLHFKTWNEYTATLSPEEFEMESLPLGYLHRCPVN